jgi:hypothetical protein
MISEYGRHCADLRDEADLQHESWCKATMRLH